MNQPKRQHTVPRSYLRNFSWDGQAVFEIRDSRCFKQSLDNATVVKNIYTFSREDGLPQYSVELALAQLEGEAAQILLKVNEQSLNGLAPTEKVRLADFIVTQHYRTRKMKHITEKAFENFQRPESKIKFLMEISGDLKRQHGFSDQEIKEQIQKIEVGEDNMNEPDFYVKAIMFSVSARLRNVILQLNWRTESISSKEESFFFITSDTPFAVRNIGKLRENRNVGLIEPEAEFYFPISTRTMLIGSHKKTESRRKLTKQRVDVLNQITIANRHSSVFSPVACPNLMGLIESLSGFKIPDVVPKI